MSIDTSVSSTTRGADRLTAPKTAYLVYDKATTADIAKWLSDLFASGLEGYSVVSLPIEQEESFFAATMKAMGLEGMDDSRKVPATVLITIFYDGQSDSSKEVFLKFRTWAAKQGSSVCLQALNSKKGTHTLKNNPDAVMSTILKKLPKESEKITASKHADPMAGSEPITSLSFELEAENIETMITAGQGECYWTVSSPPEEFEAKVLKLKQLCGKLSLGICEMCEPREVRAPTNDDSGEANSGSHRAQEFLLRLQSDLSHIEMRLAMCGNVDSGKSTLTSVLTRGYKDDGRGFARAKVFNHKHEADTGRTSSISENHLGYDANGDVVNYPKGGPMSQKHNITAQEMSERSGKIVTLYDLAGHEKYLKTTVLGMTRSMPDYACIVISANNGIQRMTKEHLGLCLALQLPFFIVVTRIDATPDNVRQQTNSTILKLLKMPTVKKIAYPIKKPEDVVVCAKNLKADRICPIFEVSNVTGFGIDDLSRFINLLPVRKDWVNLIKQPKEMIIDSTFFVTGVGTVVGGIISQGSFKVNDTVLLGPDGLGQYRQTQIKSIHVKGVDVDHVDAGNDAALCLKKEKRSAIRKGNVLICPSLQPKAYWQFEAEIVILYHSTTISNDYEPVIHSQTVRQSARILLVDQEVLRTGDRAKVRFHFLYRPEYMKIGHRLVFREGRTKGIGTVTKLIEGSVTSGGAAPLGDQRSQAKEVVRTKLHDKRGGKE